MEKSYAEYLLEKTRQDYNLIAEDFARTRHFIWDIEPLKIYVKDGDRILDLGCGSGRLIEILKDKKVKYIGLDSSQKIIEIAKKNYPGYNFSVGEALNLPFPENSFDKVFCIRVLPHIPSDEFRIKFLKEAKRVLKPKGLLILTCWYLYKFKFKRQFLLMLKNCFLKLIGKSKLDFGDAFIPWDKKVLRYYHYFTKRGLKKLVKKVDFKIKRIWATPTDLYLICQKP
jgi:ubiquinone/menaquinone biosynthesis C-methylase UbiE